MKGFERNKLALFLNIRSKLKLNQLALQLALIILVTCPSLHQFVQWIKQTNQSQFVQFAPYIYIGAKVQTEADREDKPKTTTLTSNKRERTVWHV